jgi:hypothetical protein
MILLIQLINSLIPIYFYKDFFNLNPGEYRDIEFGKNKFQRTKIKKGDQMASLF